VRIHRIVWCGAAETVLSRFGMDPRLLAMAAQILGSTEMNQLINQAHFKQPGDGIEFPWHQDSTHRRYGQQGWRDVNGRGSYVQTVTAIDPIGADNGPLRLLPGSCKLGHVASAQDGRLPAGLDPRDAIPATMTAGSVLLFGPYTYHSSPPNQSDRPRRIFINGFASPGANSRVYPGEGAGRLVRAVP
jgi:ectoine hydroxylase-related dioxygenase (phytanoyl-CoA dioxygenase family)